MAEIWIRLGNNYEAIITTYVRVQTERLESAMVRSTEAVRCPLKDDFKDLAPQAHDRGSE